MKRFVLYLSVLIFCQMVCFGQKENNIKGVVWETSLNWNKIKSKAQKEKKFIFVDCYATWCGPCKKMDREVYTNDTIGNFFNEHFISVRIQMDSTAHDDARTKSFFKVGKELEHKYMIQGYPTMLFFTSDELLIGKELGFKNVEELENTAKKLTNSVALYTQLEDYKKGIKNYPSLGKLSDFVRNVVGDRQLSYQIASNFKEDYLDKLDEKQLCSYDNLKFIVSHFQLIKSSDKIFKLFYFQPEIVDSILGIPNIARKSVSAAITREELTETLIENGKAVSQKDPNWELLRSNINIKYPKIDADKLVLDFQIGYYDQYVKNWRTWAFYKDIRIKKYPPNKNNEIEITFELNDGGAWHVFGLCNDKQVLDKALEWINLALKITTSNHPYAYLDTKANILYKLGRSNEAVETEKKALDEVLREGRADAKEQAKGYEKVITQMQSGEPTYVKEGAIWDDNTMPKKRTT